MKEIRLIRIFASCPSDISDELNSLKLVVDEINKTVGKQNSFIIQILNWNEDTYSLQGDDPQDAINQQIDDQYDLLVGLMWMRIGTPTKRDKSGTIEEINRALDNRKNFLIYFKTTPPSTLNDLVLEDIARINNYKKELSDKGVLYKEFSTISNFEKLLRLHLTNLILDKVLKNENSQNISIIPKNKKGDKKYSHISNLIDNIENYDGSNEVDIFSVTEVATSQLDIVSSSLNSMTIAMNEWSEKLEIRNKEINRINNISDIRLRTKKTKIVINLLADELLNFDARIEREIPVYSENFKKVGESYTRILLMTKSLEPENLDLIDLKKSVSDFLETSEYSLEQSAQLLKTLHNWPPLNKKFNDAKRKTELTLSNLTKEMMEGIILLSDSVEN